MSEETGGCCPTCRGKHFVIPGGDRDSTTPCMECNQDWDLRPADGVPEEVDPFPFGIHEGLPYGSLLRSYPQYLSWLREQPWIKSWPQVSAYLAFHGQKLRAKRGFR